jgi:hypothetical protein
VSVSINELTVTVPGNVIKNNTEDGDSKLRVNQEQAQSLYDQLGPVLDFFSAGSINNKTGTVTVPPGAVPEGSKSATS